MPTLWRVVAQNEQIGQYREKGQADIAARRARRQGQKVEVQRIEVEG